jgi:hypothetical protein
MSFPNEYRRYAQHCIRLAAEAREAGEESMRAILLDMAKAWTNVALVEKDVSRQSAFDMATLPARQH